jgi:hypothetical protein
LSNVCDPNKKKKKKQNLDPRCTYVYAFAYKSADLVVKNDTAATAATAMGGIGNLKITLASMTEK